MEKSYKALSRPEMVGHAPGQQRKGGESLDSGQVWKVEPIEQWMDWIWDVRNRKGPNGNFGLSNWRSAMPAAEMGHLGQKQVHGWVGGWGWQSRVLLCLAMLRLRRL